MLPPPQQARWLLESGLRLQTAGDLEAAANAYQQALDLIPEHPDALSMLGTVLLQLGNAEAAVDHLNRAARKLKNQPGVHGNLGQACIQAGQYGQAREAFRKANRLDPGNVYYPIGIATAFAAEKKLDEAESLFRKLSQRFETEPLVWFNLGNVLRDLGRPGDSLDCFNRTLQLAPDFAEARNNRGGALHAMERFSEAEQDYQECLKAVPDHISARCNLASLLTDTGRFAEAESVLRDVISSAPDLNDAHLWLGAALSHQGKTGAALASFLMARERDPQNLRAGEACAGLLVEQGRILEGMRWFARTLATQPAADVQAGFYSALLTAGRIGDAWNSYSHRPGARQIRELQPELPLVRQLPATLEGKHVCLLREQGLGDEIFFLRYASLLRARGARVTYRASPRLCDMLARAGILDTVTDENTPPPSADVHMLIGDLPRALTELPESILPAAPETNHTPTIPDYAERVAVFWPPPPPSIRLQPLPERRAEMCERLAHCGPPPYLGITWRAGTPPHLQKGGEWVLHKAIPPAELAEAVSGFSGTIIALQRRPAPVELETLSTALKRPLHDFTEINEDLESMLALLELLDEYAGVSNTNMHLRAAVGKSGRVLVPRPSEWRWLRTGSVSPWFPGFSVYRQSSDGDWKSALDKLKGDLP